MPELLEKVGTANIHLSAWNHLQFSKQEVTAPLPVLDQDPGCIEPRVCMVEILQDNSPCSLANRTRTRECGWLGRESRKDSDTRS